MHSLATPLQGRRIVLCVGGGIAAYKSVFLLRLLVKAGASVQVAMTKSAREFVGELTFQALSGAPVFTDMFALQQDADIGHIRIADGADLLVVAPATANLLARIVAGRASCPVTSAVLASRCPVLLAPAMNVNMWDSSATQSNVQTLIDRGFHFVGPDNGFLACKWTGSGRLSEPEDIQSAAISVLTPKDLQGLRILISAGGTQEDLDPVRFIGNRSSGKMGCALAKAATARGAEVHLVFGAVSVPEPQVHSLSNVRSAKEMAEAVLAGVKEADIVIMAAAVADYRPSKRSPSKLKKSEWGDAPAIALERTEDILASLGARRDASGATLVGFAAETQDLEVAARAKLQSKQCDLVVANDVSQSDRGFGSEQNAALLVWGAGQEKLDLASKDSIAHSILDRCVQLHRKRVES